MIACTSPAFTASESPLRIGVPPTVAWRLVICSIRNRSIGEVGVEESVVAGLEAGPGTPRAAPLLLGAVERDRAGTGIDPVVAARAGHPAGHPAGSEADGNADVPEPVADDDDRLALVRRRSDRRRRQ